MRFLIPARLLLAALLMLATSALPAFAQIPRTLSYQAVLTDKSGTPKPDGAYDVTFRLYDVDKGGVPLWAETQTLDVRRGLFSAVLGSVTPFGDDLTFNQQYWLSLEVAPEAELVSRLPLTASGYSLGPWTTTAPVGNKVPGEAGADNNIAYPGNVGIGTNSLEPGYRLDVRGATILTPGGLGGRIRFGTPSFETGMTIIGDNRADIRFDGSTLKLLATTGNSGPPSSTSGIAIETSGNVGIGTTTPPAGVKLAVVGPTRITAGGSGGFLQIGTPNGESGLGVTGTNRFDLRFDGSAVKLIAGLGIGAVPATNGLSVTTAGNVGVGTVSPTAKLEVIGRTKTGSLEITAGSDLAEPFDTGTDAAIEPGSVMIIDAANPGKLKMSEQPYDTRVAGIVSGAGGVNPGITLQQGGVLEGKSLVAIAGRVYCRADAHSGPIQPGDLLTTSNLSGHAMKATDRDRSHGAIIGKAMTGLAEGIGLVLVLVNLQ